MSFFDKFKGVISGNDDDEYLDDYQGDYDVDEEEVNNVSQRQAAPKEQPRDMRTGSVSMSGVSLEMKVVKPDKFEAVTQIGEHLLARRTVVLNLEETNKETIRRIIAFLSGVAFAIEGSNKRVANSTYVITPRNVEVSGDQPQARDDRASQKELF